MEQVWGSVACREALRPGNISRTEHSSKKTVGGRIGSNLCALVSLACAVAGSTPCSRLSVPVLALVECDVKGEAGGSTGVAMDPGWFEPVCGGNPPNGEPRRAD